MSATRTQCLIDGELHSLPTSVVLKVLISPCRAVQHDYIRNCTTRHALMFQFRPVHRPVPDGLGLYPSAVRLSKLRDRRALSNSGEAGHVGEAGSGGVGKVP